MHPKIALIKKDFQGQGGLEKISLRILHALKERGADLTVLTTGSPSLPCNVLSYRLEKRFRFQQLREFDTCCRTVLESCSFDAVFSFDRGSYQTHHRAGNGVHAAYLEIRKKHDGFLKALTFSMNPLHRAILQLERTTFEDPRLRKLIVNSHFVKNQILQFYSTPAEKIEVVHNGVEWQEMEPAFVEKKDRYHFLFIGHNFHRKGVAPLLQAARRLKRDFHLSIVGTDKNLLSYQKLAAAFGLSKKVTFFGAQSDSRPFYQAADALVIPSLYDPFANVTLEALAMGLFVISSPMNGGHEVLTPSSGTVVDPFNLEAFIAAMESAPEKTPSSAQQIRLSVQHLDFPHQLEKICKLCI